MHLSDLRLERTVSSTLRSHKETDHIARLKLSDQNGFQVGRSVNLR